MKNIHVLATPNPSRLYYTISMNGYVLHLSETPKIKSSQLRHQYIYITDNSEIKEGDWCFELYNGESKAINPVMFIDELGNKWYLRKANMNYPANDNECKKIILTDNPELIKEGVQSIPNEFLEWFVKNSSREFVEVVNDEFYLKKAFIEGENAIAYEYKIIIPSEENNIIDNWLQKNGNPEIDKQVEEEAKNLLKTEIDWSGFPKSTQEKVGYIETKQETLEEVKDLKYYRANAEEDYMQTPISVLRYITELEQSKNKYSEEDMKKYGEFAVSKFLNVKKTTLTKNYFSEFIEQFKKQ